MEVCKCVMLHSAGGLFYKDKYPEYGNHKMSFKRLQITPNVYE